MNFPAAASTTFHGPTTLALVMLAASLAAGCTVLRAEPDDSRYFALSSMNASPSAAPARARPDIHFGLGPVKVPGYLDTQALVRSNPGGSIEYVSDAFWAEPLGEGFSRALLYRTSTRIGTTNATAYPWYSTTGVDWKIPVDVLRFEATADGRAILVARWSVERVSNGEVVAGTESVFEETAGNDPVLIVDALSRCVDRLAETIATAVTSAAARTARVGDSGRSPR
ncbi:MAG: membrane integrity-associated transporter subunit PqiC [Candidatus Binatia bacterium]